MKTWHTTRIPLANGDMRQFVILAPNQDNDGQAAAAALGAVNLFLGERGKAHAVFDHGEHPDRTPDQEASPENGGFVIWERIDGD